MYPWVAHNFKVGDLVWLDLKDIKLKILSWKLMDQQLGPFKITEKVGDLDYCLQLPFAHHRCDEVTEIVYI